MFGRTILCIYHDQPINQQRKTKATYRNRTPTYTDTEDEYSTKSETDDENQDSRSPIRKTTTKPNQEQTRKQPSITDNQKNIEKNIQQTTITTRKAKTNATKPEYKIDNPAPTLGNSNFPQLPKQTEKEDDQQKQKTTDHQKTQMTSETTAIPETRPEDMPDIMAIPETGLEAMPQTQTPEILSPSVATNNRFQTQQKTPNTTLETFDSSTPNINNIATNKELIPLDQQQPEAKALATRLHQRSFTDTGCLIMQQKKRKNDY